MIKGVIGKIAKTTKIPVLTVHDSIIALPQHKDQIIELLKCEFKEKMGVVPILKEKEHKLIGKLDLPMAIIASSVSNRPIGQLRSSAGYCRACFTYSVY
jgi:hypothetical protein